jgi:transposase-like protein
MFDPFDPWIYEICFPGAVSGETEVTCPHCGTLLTVPVDDPMGRQTYRCAECGKKFSVDWGA